ncbi:hypothetical protein IV203_025785 [Nitzschia inconspicua]|uniref:Uncharacterized protein n=1 Tax=Nitzschia inconspicua TaxID=303405 RepID=A0A9K3LGR4_9STRA|nr:hypothetical protein IV203_025785 [Nitzschia inconspicua]
MNSNSGDDTMKTRSCRSSSLSCSEETGKTNTKAAVSTSASNRSTESFGVRTRNFSKFLKHPYLDAMSRRRRPMTLSEILLAERRLLRDLKLRSGWEVYPRGPPQYFTQIQAKTQEDRDNEDREDGATMSSSAHPPSSQDDCHVGRVNSLTLNDLTVYALLEVLDRYLHSSRRWRPSIIGPVVPPTPPPWTMPEDIAILDQLQSMELFQCTGAMPESMNHLLHLERIKLRSCHGLQLQTLRMNNVKDLEITDSEGILPSTFANLPQLERLKLYRIASSDANTRTIGRDWVRDLKENTFAWNNSLKDLCFCSAGLKNEDLATLLVDTLTHKFPALRALFVISNSDITSFQSIMMRWTEQYQQTSNGDLPTNFIPPSLRVLSLTGTRIQNTRAEMQSIHQFLQLYNEIGLFMTMSLPPMLRADVIQSVHLINHQLTLNRAGAPVLLSCNDNGDGRKEGPPSEEGIQQTHSKTLAMLLRRRRPLALSMWPIVLERAMNLEYVPCYQTSDDGASMQENRRWNGATFGTGGEAVMERVDRVIARARILFQNRALQNNLNNNNNNNDGVNIPFFNNGINANAPNAGVASQEDVILEGNWMEDLRAFSARSRYDAVYYLLRHGPVLLATDDRKPRCRRQRSFMARKCKRIKLF